MQRVQIYQHIAANVGDTFGTPGGSEMIFAYKDIVTHAYDEVAERSRCYWKVASMPLVANTPQFGSPSLLEMQALTMFTADGNPHMVDPAVTAAMDDTGGATWRNMQAGGQVYTVVTQGLNSGVLVPAPNFNSIVYPYVDLALSGGGLIVSSAARPFVNAAAPDGDVNLFLNFPTTGAGLGFTPGWCRIVSVDDFGNATLLTPGGTAGSTAGAATLTSGGLWMEGPGVPGDIWPNLTDECPLPTFAHWTGIWGACMLRCIRTPNPANVARYPWLKERFDSGLASLLVETKNFTYASRIPALVGLGDGGFMGAWDSTYGNPLNM